MSTSAKSGITAFTGFAIVPAFLSFIVAYLFTKGGQAKTATLVNTAFIAIGFPAFLSLWWPDLLNSLKKSGATDVDSSTAGTWISISLMVCYLAAFFGLYIGSKGK